jgi:hypothetical protein
MKYCLLALFSCLAIFNAYAQLTPTVTPVVDQFGIIKAIPAKPLNPQGSVYLNDEWLSSNIYLKRGLFATDKIEQIPIKVDLMTNSIELKTKEGIKVLHHAKVDRFEWFNPKTNTNEVYINGNNFTLNGTQFNNFCSVYGDRATLVKYSYVEVHKADYNVALDVGNKQDRLLKKSKFYLLKDKELIEVSKKSLCVVMAEKADEIKEFIKKNRVDFGREQDLRSIIDYYDSLVQ